MNARRLIHHPQASADPLNELYAIRSGEEPPQNTRPKRRGRPLVSRSLRTLTTGLIIGGVTVGLVWIIFG